MASLLLTDGYVVTVDADRRVIPSGFVRIDGDRITEIGPMTEVGEPGEARVIPLDGRRVPPGFPTGQTPHGGSLFKNTGEGLLLEPWLDQITIPLMGQLAREDLRIA